MVKCSKSQIRKLKMTLRWKLPAAQRVGKHRNPDVVLSVALRHNGRMSSEQAVQTSGQGHRAPLSTQARTRLMKAALDMGGGFLALPSRSTPGDQAHWTSGVFM
jgi:hypothetical protein